MAANTVYWLFSTGSVSSCSGDLSSYTFSASACAANGICSLGSVAGNAAIQVGAAYYGPSGQAQCDGQQHPANLASSASSGASDLGTYACAVGGGNLEVAAPCNAAQSLSIAAGSYTCDTLFYRSSNPTPCLEMIGCDSSLTNCLSYLGDRYICDGQVHDSSTGSGDSSYICSCTSQILNPPSSAGGFTFPGSAPSTGGCGLPRHAPAGTTGLSTSASTTSLASSTSVSSTPPSSISSSTTSVAIDSAAASSALASIQSRLQASASSVASAASASAASLLSSISAASASSASVASQLSVSSAAAASSSSLAALSSASVQSALSSASAAAASSASAASASLASLSSLSAASVASSLSSLASVLTALSSTQSVLSSSAASVASTTGLSITSSIALVSTSAPSTAVTTTTSIPSTTPSSVTTRTSTSTATTSSPNAADVVQSAVSDASSSAFNAASSGLAQASSSVFGPGSVFAQNNGNSGGLSSGTKIGLGVGLGVGGAVLLSAIAALIWARRRPRSEYESGPMFDDDAEAPDTTGLTHNQGPNMSHNPLGQGANATGEGFGVNQPAYPTYQSRA